MEQWKGQENSISSAPISSGAVGEGVVRGPSHRHTRNALRSAPGKRTPIAWTGEHLASSSLERGHVLVCDSRERHKPLLEHVNLIFVQKVSSFQEKNDTFTSSVSQEIFPEHLLSHYSGQQSTQVIVALWKGEQSWKRQTQEKFSPLCPLEIPFTFSGIRFPEPNREAKDHNLGVEAGQEYLQST